MGCLSKRQHSLGAKMSLELKSPRLRWPLAPELEIVGFFKCSWVLTE